MIPMVLQGPSSTTLNTHKTVGESMFLAPYALVCLSVRQGSRTPGDYGDATVRCQIGPVTTRLNSAQELYDTVTAVYVVMSELKAFPSYPPDGPCILYEAQKTDVTEYDATCQTTKEEPAVDPCKCVSDFEYLITCGIVQNFDTNPQGCEVRNKHHEVIFVTAQKHTDESVVSIGCVHYSHDHAGVVDVIESATVTGLGRDISYEIADVSAKEGCKAGSTKACSHCFPDALVPTGVTFEIAKITIASDCIKEFGLTGDFSHSDARVVACEVKQNGIVKPGRAKTHVGCHGTGLKDPILQTRKVTHDNTSKEQLTDYPVVGTADDTIGCHTSGDVSPAAFVGDCKERTPRGSGVDGIAGVNKNLTKTTGNHIENHVQGHPEHDLKKLGGAMTLYSCPGLDTTCSLHPTNQVDPIVRYRPFHSEKHDTSKLVKEGLAPSSVLFHLVVEAREYTFDEAEQVTTDKKSKPHATNVVKTVSENGTGICINIASQIVPPKSSGTISQKVDGIASDFTQASKDHVEKVHLKKGQEAAETNRKRTDVVANVTEEAVHFVVFVGKSCQFEVALLEVFVPTKDAIVKTTVQKGNESFALVTFDDGIRLIVIIQREKCNAVVPTFVRDFILRTQRGQRLTTRFYVVTCSKAHFVVNSVGVFEIPQVVDVKIFKTKGSGEKAIAQAVFEDRTGRESRAAKRLTVVKGVSKTAEQTLSCKIEVVNRKPPSDSFEADFVKSDIKQASDSQSKCLSPEPLGVRVGRGEILHAKSSIQSRGDCSSTVNVIGRLLTHGGNSLIILHRQCNDGKGFVRLNLSPEDNVQPGTGTCALVDKSQEHVPESSGKTEVSEQVFVESKVSRVKTKITDQPDDKGQGAEEACTSAVESKVTSFDRRDIRKQSKVAVDNSACKLARTSGGDGRVHDTGHGGPDYASVLGKNAKASATDIEAHLNIGGQVLKVILTGVTVKPVVKGKVQVKKNSGSTQTQHKNAHTVHALTGINFVVIAKVPNEVENHDGFVSTTVHVYRTEQGSSIKIGFVYQKAVADLAYPLSRCHNFEVKHEGKNGSISDLKDNLDIALPVENVSSKDTGENCPCQSAKVAGQEQVTEISKRVEQGPKDNHKSSEDSSKSFASQLERVHYVKSCVSLDVLPRAHGAPT